jgi:hypothetical protein
MIEAASEAADARGAAFAWGPVWAGFFMVAALQVVLQLLGVAVGITAVRPSLRPMQDLSIWSAAWMAVSTLSAFFFGGWFAAAASPVDRRGARARALAVWAFATTLGVLLVALGLGGAINVARVLLWSNRGRATGMTPYAIAAAWATFGTLAFSLVCALLGAQLGSPAPARRRRNPAHRPASTEIPAGARM